MVSKGEYEYHAGRRDDEWGKRREGEREDGADDLVVLMMVK